MQEKAIENQDSAKVRLDEVKLGGEIFYKISNVDQMRPFFMTIVSDSNHWLFVSSNGGLTAGRKNSEYALFPYYTDDKITESCEHTGCKTLIRIRQNGSWELWEPFSMRSENTYSCQRNLYKNRYGNKIVFEEINLALGLSFAYEWNNSNQFGFVRKVSLRNFSESNVEIEIIDGFQNVLPYGVGADLQNAASNLADAYKRTELLPYSGLGLFTLSAIIVDKAEPSESLKANTIWSKGLDQPTYLLSSKQLPAFRMGNMIHQEEDIKGDKGAYLVHSQFPLGANQNKHWYLVANVNQTQSAVVELDRWLRSSVDHFGLFQADVEAGTRHLLELVGAADGIQLTADDRQNTRHFSNVLFNIMRGGIFDAHYTISKSDFLLYLQKANRALFEEYKGQFSSLSENIDLAELKAIATKSDNTSLQRLTSEYLPLKFSRRHGDPSRPWNKFTINTRSEIDGSKILDYEGNWRDIFQNWEALSHAYPEYIEGMVFKFLNASTFDGYNPYRVTKGGFDWETIEHDNPWSYIGYWGDHQIIYLLKLLEFAKSKEPKAFDRWLHAQGFVFAHVPYKIKAYDSIVKNPKDTIDFDFELDKQLRTRMESFGADGALLTDAHGEIYQVSFLEKILASVLAKLSNLVPEGGIWMNTQRPEWNDANNALVGNGLSVVTVCYLRRFLSFFIPILKEQKEEKVQLSEELSYLLSQVTTTFHDHMHLLGGKMSGKDRKIITDALGISGSEFRTRIYQAHFSGRKATRSVSEILDLFHCAIGFLEHTIHSNRRSNGLYHTYNLISYRADGIEISHLNAMLEGQVAVLSSGLLSVKQSLEVLNALRNSALYREDQNSYMLYPNKSLARFLEKNQLPDTLFQQSRLLKKLHDDGNRLIVETDIEGHHHFNGNFRNANDLEKSLLALDPVYQPLVSEEQHKILEIFESVFNHKEFTGRSGTFYGYEGLGSIYWHMVSKLALAVQENCLRAFKEDAETEVKSGLVNHYYAIQAGIGVHKSPEQYGAFPTDPYSHTPLGKGAQQPGMTGQVKEDILCRWGELGIEWIDGCVSFNPQLLKISQFSNHSETIIHLSILGETQNLFLTPHSLYFTLCQVPVFYELGEDPMLEVFRTDGTKRQSASLMLTEEESSALRWRDGSIEKIRLIFNQTRFIQ